MNDLKRLLPVCLLIFFVFATGVFPVDTGIRGYFDVFNSVTTDSSGLQTIRWDLGTFFSLDWKKLNFSFSSLMTGDSFLIANPEILFREVYLNLPLSSVLELRVGRQVISWGSTDQFSPSDFVSSYDLREFITKDKDEIRIGIDAVALSLFLKDTKLDLIWSPFSRQNLFPRTGSPWVKPGFKSENLTDGSGNSLGKENEKAGGSFFGKYSFFLKGFDISFTGFSFMNEFPYPVKDANGNLINKYERLNGFGFYFSKPWDFIVFRGEYLFFRKRLIRNSGDNHGFHEKNRSEILLGADIFLRNEWSITLQMLFNYIPGDLMVSFPDEKSSALTASVSGKIFGNSIWFNSFLSLLIDHSDGLYHKLTLNFPLDDSFKIMAGYDLFQGKSSSLYGHYLKNSQIWLKFKYIF